MRFAIDESIKSIISSVQLAGVSFVARDLRSADQKHVFSKTYFRSPRFPTYLRYLESFRSQRGAAIGRKAILEFLEHIMRQLNSCPQKRVGIGKSYRDQVKIINAYLFPACEKDSVPAFSLTR